jgi:hypothetical protein
LSAILSVTVHPGNPRIVYAGSGPGILRSADGGISWSLLPNSPMSAVRIVVDPRSGGNMVWAGTGSGLWVSADDGATWTSVSLAGVGLDSFSVDDMEWTVSGDLTSFTMFVGLHDTGDGSHNGIYRADGAGGSWALVDTNAIDYMTGLTTPASDWGRITLGADHTPGSTVPPVLLMSKKNPDWRHAIVLNVFKLAAGAWTPIGASLIRGLDTQGGANQPITVTPSGVIYFGVSGDYSPAFFQSVDGGNSWSDISTAGGVGPHVDHHALLWDGGVLYDGNDGGIWRFWPRDDGTAGPGVWQSVNSAGLQTIEVQGVSIRPGDPSTILAGSQDNGTGRLSGGAWTEVQGNDRGRVRFDPGSGYAYSVTYGWFDHSADSGVHWSPITLPAGEFAPGSMQYFVVDPFGTSRVMVAGLHGTWLSGDYGGSWLKIAPALTGEPNSVTSVAFSPDPGTIYLAFGDGSVYLTGNAGGDGSAGNWSTISGATSWGGTIVSIAPDPLSSAGLYLAADAGRVWRTTDGGASWQDLTADLPPIEITGALAVAAKPNGPHVFVGTSSGVYRCQYPAIPSWERFGTGIPYVRVSDLDYQPNSDVLAAGTYGRGVFTTVAGPGPTTGFISGQVTDVSGTPILDADMTLYFPDGSFRELAPTDSAGHYATDPLPPGSYRLDCVRDGYVPVQVTVTLPVGAPHIFRDFALARTLPFTITGTVTSLAGPPIANATITLVRNSAVPGILTTTTDGSGNYTITMDPGPYAGSYDISAKATGFATRDILIASVPNGATITQNFVLPASATVSGQVSDTRGAAIAGATVTASSASSSPASTTTDSAGHYTLAALAPDTYTVTATAFAFQAGTATVTVGVGATAKQDFVLADAVTGTVTGLVFDDLDATPLPGATVRATGGPSTGTDDNGNYSLTLPSGTMVLTAAHPRYLDARTSVDVVGMGTITTDIGLVPRKHRPRPQAQPSPDGTDAG